MILKFPIILYTSITPLLFMNVSKIHVLGALSTLLLVACSGSGQQQKREPVKITVDPKTDHIRGNVSAQVSLVEYGDFECPFCRQHHPTMVSLSSKYGNRVNWVYRHYPLSFIHKTAQKAAEASECARELGGAGAFWQYADLLYEKGSKPESFVAYARTVGLDANKFQSCVDSGKYETKVKEQMKEGQTHYVKSTPTTFVVDNKTKMAKELSGVQPIENFEKEIDAILN